MLQCALKVWTYCICLLFFYGLTYLFHYKMFIWSHIQLLCHPFLFLGYYLLKTKLSTFLHSKPGFSFRISKKEWYIWLNFMPQCYGQWVYKAPICITLRIKTWVVNSKFKFIFLRIKKNKKTLLYATFQCGRYNI